MDQKSQPTSTKKAYLKDDWGESAVLLAFQKLKDIGGFVIAALKSHDMKKRMKQYKDFYAYLMNAEKFEADLVSALL